MDIARRVCACVCVFKCVFSVLPLDQLWCWQPQIQNFAKYRAIFVSIQMFAKYCGTIFGRFWFWIFTLPSALLMLRTHFEAFVPLEPSVTLSTNPETFQFFQLDGNCLFPILSSCQKRMYTKREWRKMCFFGEKKRILIQFWPHIISFSKMRN